MKCVNCKNKFSEELFIEDTCPICVLEYRNKLHGLPKDTPFTGEQAQMMYDQAMDELDSQTNTEKE